MQLKHVVNGSVYQTESFLEGETPTSSGGNCTVFSGATSSTMGTSGIVPAPAAGDQNKFLRADGTWQTVGGGGADMSSNSFVYSVLNQIGNKFVPTVDSAAKLDQYKDSNLPYMDNRIKKILEGKGGYQSQPYWNNSENHDRFVNNTVKLDVKYNSSTSVNYVDGGAATLALDTDGTTYQYTYNGPMRVSESAGLIRVSIQNIAKGTNGAECLQSIKIDPTTLAVTKTSRVTVCPAASTTATQNGVTYVDADGSSSLTDPYHLIYITDVQADNATGSTHTYGF